MKPTDEVVFVCGLSARNRFMLAPMTNTQSHEDGVLSDEEYRWLTMRAQGSFGITITCASHVQAAGRGFPGQLGCFSDDHLPGLKRLAAAIKAEQSIALVQLHHAGMRSPADLIGQAPMAPSDIPDKGARGITTPETERLRDDFIAAAVRCKEAGVDGVQVHGAHGYIVAQFLSPTYNQRQDHYGGSLDGRARLLFEIVDGIRARCGPEFLVSVRLSPERFGMRLTEVLEVSQRLVDSGNIDLLDLSLWDVFKPPHEEAHQGRSLLDHCLTLKRGRVKLTVAGKIYTAADVRRVLGAGVDIVSIGRAAILHHDFPERVAGDPGFEPTALPVSLDYLAREGVSEVFADYLRRWDGFVSS